MALIRESHQEYVHLGPSTRGLLDPVRVLQGIGLQRGQAPLDAGPGEGHFSLAAAAMVGGEGHVYAVDVRAEAIAPLQAAVRERGLANVTVLVADLAKQLPVPGRPHPGKGGVAMLAMILYAPVPVEEDPLAAIALPDPVPGAGQVRLQVHACAVCHTDLHTVEGDLRLPRLPLIPGHQIVGVVDALGPGASRYRVGERVGVGWLSSIEGECEFARRGQENLCPNARFTGLDVDGGYAQYTLADERFAFPIPGGFSDTEAAPLLCAGIIGYRSLRLSEVKPGERLGLYGFGASAHIVIQVARHWGCQVYVFSRGEEHRRLAEHLGAAWTGTAEESAPAPLDAAITFAPAGRLVPLALGHLRPGGTLAINAIAMSPIPEMPYDLLYRERTLRSVTNYTRRDAEEFLLLAGEIPIRTEVEVFPLAQANEALRRLKHGRIRGSAVLTIPCP